MKLASSIRPRPAICLVCFCILFTDGMPDMPLSILRSKKKVSSNSTFFYSTVTPLSIINTPFQNLGLYPISQTYLALIKLQKIIYTNIYTLNFVHIFQNKGVPYSRWRRYHGSCSKVLRSRTAGLERMMPVPQW